MKIAKSYKVAISDMIAGECYRVYTLSTSVLSNSTDYINCWKHSDDKSSNIVGYFVKYDPEKETILLRDTKNNDILLQASDVSICWFPYGLPPCPLKRDNADKLIKFLNKLKLNTFGITDDELFNMFIIGERPW